MGIMTTISVIIIAILFITIIGFGAQGRSELYHILRSKLLATGGQTPNQQWLWKGAQPTATTVGRGRGTTGGRGEPTTTTVGRGRGEPTPKGTTEGRGDTMGWGGGGGA